MSRMLEAALRYARLGLAVIPLHGKRPFFQDWPDKATSDRTRIERWWTQEPEANVGIATGRKSNLFVVDIDVRGGGQDSVEEWIHDHGQLPETWTDLTGGGGTHLFFRYPSFSVKNFTALCPGIDIRGDGGQVVAPPSIHPDTHNEYSWDGMAELEDQQLAEAPLWLLELLKPKDVVPSGKKGVAQVDVRIPTGTRHKTLLSMAGFLRRMGLTAEEIYPSLWAVNQARCDEPEPQGTIRAIADGVMRYQPGDQNLFKVSTQLWRMTRAVEYDRARERDAMTPIDGLSMVRQNFSSPKCIIEDLLYTGLTIVAGRPKSGKSWLALQIAINVGTGTPFMGMRTIARPGRVAFWALEESPERTSGRLKRLTVEMPELQHLEFLYQAPPLLAGGLAVLDRHIAGVKPELVIIDTLLAIVQSGEKRDVMRQDYKEIDVLRRLAIKHDCAILLVHHLSKREGGAGLDNVAGSTGVTAAADAVWTMKRQADRVTLLEITGREIEEQTFAMKLDLIGGIGWYPVAEGEEADMTMERMEILEYLREEGPTKPKKIADELGKNRGAVRNLLRKMVESGSVVKNMSAEYWATKME
jgi:hypothetical protein